MTAQNNPHHVAQSVEPTRLTYVLRRSIVGVAFVAIAVVGFVATGGFSIPGTGAVDSGSVALGGQVGRDGDEVLGDESTTTTNPATTTTTVAADGEATATPPADTPDPIGSMPKPAVLENPRLPERTSSFVPQAPQRVLDTTGGDLPALDTVHRAAVPGDRTAVALSISLIGSTQAGSVVVDGRAGQVTVLTVGKAGTSATNLVIVPILGQDVTVRSSAGGHLTVDVVGSFQASQEAAGGRFEPVDPVQIARLETAVDGRETALTLDGVVPPDAAAVLVAINADVGAKGGVVRFGPAQGEYNQMLMWGPATGGNLQRRGLVLIEPSEIGAGYLRYDGGTLLTADVVGYFTGAGAETSTAGLYVPSGPRQLFTGSIESGRPIDLTGVEPAGGTAVITITSPESTGQAGSFVTPVVDGDATLLTEIAGQADVVLLGVFIEG